MTSRDPYLDCAARALSDLPARDRRHALAALVAQLDEMRALGRNPGAELGTPEAYAAALRDELCTPTDPAAPAVRLLGVPADWRGPFDPRVRARTLDPRDPRLLVPRLLGAGWDLNLGALAVRLRLLRPDDLDRQTLADVPAAAMAVVRAVPVALAAAGAVHLARSWHTVPDRVPTGFDLVGRPTSWSGRWSLVASVGAGVLVAGWSRLPDEDRGDQLVRSAHATMLVTLLDGALVASVRSARRAGAGRDGLLAAASVPVATAAGVAVVVVPVRAGLRRAWAGAVGGAR